MEQEYSREVAKVVAPYQGVTSLTQEQATIILQTCWPKAPDVEVFKAAVICKMYRLNPLMKHLFLVEFKGKEGSTWTPIIGIQATRLIASRNHRYSYLIGPRVMTREEQKDIFGEVDEANIQAITILKDEHGNQASGYGNWPRDKAPYGSDKGNSRANMAFIRSERQAFDRLFPGEMPQGVEVGDLQFIPGPEQRPALKKGLTPTKPIIKDISETSAGNGGVTQAQINKLWAEAGANGYGKEEIHAAIMALYGVTSVKDLFKSQAAELIDMLVKQQDIMRGIVVKKPEQAELK